MRRLSEERGAIAVLVAAVLVLMIGTAAVVVDVGMIYQERRELQNGADAAASAIARDCALRTIAGQPCNTDVVGAFATARELADANASDGAAHVPDGHGVQINQAARTVTVLVESQDADSGANTLGLAFARAIGWDSITVAARSTATWGAVVGGWSVPIAVSWDCYSGLVRNEHRDSDPMLRVLLHHGTGHEDDEGCKQGSAGQRLPGGFGWLDVTSGTPCRPWLELGEVSSSQGRSMPAGCGPAEWLNRMQDSSWTILLPIYDCVGKGGIPCPEDSPPLEERKSYRISHFAVMHVHGYQFHPDGAYYPSQAEASVICGGSHADCLYGHLYGDVIPLGTIGTNGGAKVQIVRLID